MPCSAKNARAGEGTAVSPVAQLFPENRGINFPNAACSVALSGNWMRICMTNNKPKPCQWQDLPRVRLKKIIDKFRDTQVIERLGLAEEGEDAFHLRRGETRGEIFPGLGQQ